MHIQVGPSFLYISKLSFPCYRSFDIINCCLLLDFFFPSDFSSVTFSCFPSILVAIPSQWLLPIFSSTLFNVRGFWDFILNPIPSPAYIFSLVNFTQAHNFKHHLLPNEFKLRIPNSDLSRQLLSYSISYLNQNCKI